uniref:BRICHOS domain containing 5 n=1 Tax=Seriola lalandi dorsalis TaxID=1841481 RepID=A0A3B4WRH6_SERLL
MVRCWKHSENRLEEAQCTQSHFPHKAFWVSLSASLLLVVITLGLTGYLGMNVFLQSLQIVRIAAPDQTGALINQSAVVDQQNDLVTFSVTSPANQTSTVLFDIKHQGLICYKPVEQDSCLLRKMEPSDYDNVHSLLHESTHKSHFQLSGNETQRHTEFLGVLAANQVDVSTLEEPLQALCRDRSVHWTKRAKPGKQRLVYFCIDICFPSNICVSVCFYYLPE